MEVLRRGKQCKKVRTLDTSVMYIYVFIVLKGFQGYKIISLMQVLYFLM